MGKDAHIEVIARGVHLRQNAVLLCRNVDSGYFFLPGGHVEFGEPAAVALARELDEECGVRARVGPLLLTTEQSFEQSRGATAGGRPKTKAHHEINLVFLVEHLETAEGDEPERVESREPEIEFHYVDLAAITDTDLRPLELRAWLAAGGATDADGPPWISGVGRES